MKLISQTYLLNRLWFRGWGRQDLTILVLLCSILKFLKSTGCCEITNEINNTKMASHAHASVRLYSGTMVLSATTKGKRECDKKSSPVIFNYNKFKSKYIQEECGFLLYCDCNSCINMRLWNKGLFHCMGVLNVWFYIKLPSFLQ